MLTGLVAWQAAAVQFIRREAREVGFWIDGVYKASSGSWYVRLIHGTWPDRRRVVVRLSDHPPGARAVGRRVYCVDRRRPDRLRYLGRFLAAMASGS
jgi:hypothetical protein